MPKKRKNMPSWLPKLLSVLLPVAIFATAYLFAQSKVPSSLTPGNGLSADAPSVSNDKNTEPGGTTNQQNLPVNIYFLDAVTKTTLVPEVMQISNEANDKLVRTVLQKLVDGSKNPNMLSTVPSNVVIESVLLKNDAVEVSLSSEYSSLKPTEELFLRASLVWTLTDLSFINSVKIFAGGKEISKSDGELFGYIKREDIVLEPTSDVESANQFTQKLYFSNISASLAVEERVISVTPSQKRERVVLEQLIAGPQSEDLSPTIPPETKILNIEVKNNVCYIDLSSDFVTKHNGGSSGEFLTIYSIVNSLTELPEITKVQFFIEGEKQDTFKGHIDLSTSFERLEMD